VDNIKKEKEFALVAVGRLILGFLPKKFQKSKIFSKLKNKMFFH
jgi:hypothetical protein